MEIEIKKHEIKKDQRLDDWRRWRVMVADFRNVNRKKTSKAVYPKDLIRLPEDDRLPEYHEIDIEAIKRRFGSKIKKRGK